MSDRRCVEVSAVEAAKFGGFCGYSVICGFFQFR